MFERYYNTNGKLRVRFVFAWPFISKKKHNIEMKELRDAVNKFHQERMDRLLEIEKALGIHVSMQQGQFKVTKEDAPQ